MFRFEYRIPSLPAICTFIVVLPMMVKPVSARDKPGRGIAQPTTYRSNSGVYSLHVVPHDRRGETGADYRLLKEKTELWSGKRDYTLREVTVTNEGCVVGMAYRAVQAEPGEGRRGPDRYLHIVVLDEQGTEFLNDVKLRSRKVTHYGSPVPWVEQFIVDPPNDLIVVRVVERDQGLLSLKDRPWCTYRLSTGEQLGRFDPSARLPNRGRIRWLIDARPLAGTPFILVHWLTGSRNYSANDRGGRFVLVDFSGKPIWTLDEPNDYVGWGYDIGTFASRPAMLPAGKPGHFDIRLFATGEQVTFAVEQKGPDEWTVSEVDRRPYVRPPPPAEIPVDAPIGTLTYLGALSIELGEIHRTDGLDSIAALTIAPDGRIYAIAKRTGGIHIYDSCGVLERIDAPAPADFGGAVNDAFIVTTMRGDYYVSRPTVRAYPPPDEYVYFSPDGERMGIVTFNPIFKTTRSGPGWAFQPTTRYRLGFVSRDAPMIVDPSGTVVRQIAKRPNGEWFRLVMNFAMASDGSIAFLCLGRNDDFQQNEVDLFSAKGNPLRTITLPRASERFSGLAYDGRRVVVAGNGEVLIVNATDYSVERWALVEPGVTDFRWNAYITADGRELLLHERMNKYCAPTLHRYQLP